MSGKDRLLHRWFLQEPPLQAQISHRNRYGSDPLSLYLWEVPSPSMFHLWFSYSLNDCPDRLWQSWILLPRTQMDMSVSRSIFPNHGEILLHLSFSAQSQRNMGKVFALWLLFGYLMLIFSLFPGIFQAVPHRRQKHLPETENAELIFHLLLSPLFRQYYFLFHLCFPRWNQRNYHLIASLILPEVSLYQFRPDPFYW